MQSPQLFEIDPTFVKCSSLNPRQHGGEEYQRLKSSIAEIGIIVSPLVRMLPGGAYETIDGAGRVQVAQELRLSKIWVVNLGYVSDTDALVMLQSANSVREFNFIAECKGMAQLHRQGITMESLARTTGKNRTSTLYCCNIGYFDDDILMLIAGHALDPEILPAKSIQLGLGTIQLILPLSQVKPGMKSPSITGVIEGVYDYSEVRIAVQKIVSGEISSRAELTAYVEQRRRGLFEQKFDQELNQRLKEEKEKAEQAIKEAAQRQLDFIEQQSKQRYQERIDALQKQHKELEKQYSHAMKAIAKRQEDQKLIDELERNLEEQRRKTEAERKHLEEMQTVLRARMQEEMMKEQARVLSDLQRKQEADLAAKREEMRRQYQESARDLQAQYAQKDRDRQLKAEVDVRASVAHGVELLAQLQQWLVHITSPKMLSDLSGLNRADILSLVSALESVEDTVSAVKEKILRGDMVVPSIEEGN